MKSKKGSKTKHYDTTEVLKKSSPIITKNDSAGLSKLSWQAKKAKH